VLAAHPEFRLQKLCTAIGTPARTLRAYCHEFLGVGPIRYRNLRRLAMARAALHNANSRDTSVEEVALRHGFRQSSRFAAAYRAVFGEPPSATLLRDPR
jgi:AraC family ethanolamine operon transcriptional activator